MIKMPTLGDTSEDMAVPFSSEEQHIYIKFESYRKKNVWKIHVALQEVCGNSALSYLQFNRGRECKRQ